MSGRRVVRALACASFVLAMWSPEMGILRAVAAVVLLSVAFVCTDGDLQ